jgi:integrase
MSDIETPEYLRAERVRRNARGWHRRSLKFISGYPTPQELYEKITNSEGWPYKINETYYHNRDRALVSMLYLLALRVSEAVRLTKKQAIPKEKVLTVRSILLSKRFKRDKPRQSQYRQEGFIVLNGDRGKLGQIVLDYLERLDPEERLFPFDTHRAWEVVTATLGEPPHWLRAYGEDYLYYAWDKDLIAVADYVKVDERTLAQYLRKRYAKYKPV